MTHQTATARSFSNIAFIKYWGNHDDALRLPSNGSISMNLRGIETITTVRFDPLLPADRLALDGVEQQGAPLERVSRHLDVIRSMAGIALHAAIESRNNFPTGTGIASSASAFSALTVAACAALGLALDERTLSRLARRGSGSACRSVPGGFVEWYAGSDDETSFAETIAPPDYWDLVDLVAVVSSEHKSVGSTGGHALAPTSPLQGARVADTPRRLDACRSAILSRNFAQLADVIEHDTLLMHAVMMTSRQALIYWQPATLRIIEGVRQWRMEGLDASFTIDAGPNVHVITTVAARGEVRRRLEQVDGIKRLLEAGPGGPAEVLG
jgi:diphosphomevalonate decarboxylase